MIMELRKENTTLKKKTNEQEDTIRKMRTRFAIMEDKLKRANPGAGVNFLADEIDAAQKAAELQAEIKDLKRKNALLTDKCRQLTLKLKKALPHSKSKTPRPSETPSAPLAEVGGNNQHHEPLEDQNLENQLRQFSQQARGTHQAKQTQEIVAALRARLVTAEKQLVWLRQENSALSEATEEATRLRPKSAGMVGGRDPSKDQQLVELERQLREKNAKLTLLKSRYENNHTTATRVALILQCSLAQTVL